MTPATFRWGDHPPQRNADCLASDHDKVNSVGIVGGWGSFTPTIDVFNPLVGIIYLSWGKLIPPDVAV